jgi:hypothetical protein
VAKIIHRFGNNPDQYRKMTLNAGIFDLRCLGCLATIAPAKILIGTIFHISCPGSAPISGQIWFNLDKDRSKGFAS